MRHAYSLFASLHKDFPICTLLRSPRFEMNYRKEHSARLTLSFRASSRKSGDSLKD